jgi:MFS family permease
MMVLDVLIVSVALPAMQRELHLSPAGLEWVVSGYALALAALIPTGGALGDHFGRKRIFVSGVTLFTLASIGCALSVSGTMLVGFRVIQGIGGAVMSSLTLSLISEAYPPEARTGPLGVSTVVICLAAVRESREPVPRSFDIPGVALSASGLLLLTFGFVESSDIGWHSPAAAACVAGGIVVLAVFVAWERTAAAPMVPPALLRTQGRHARDEPAGNDDTVFLARSVLHRRGSGLRPDGPGGLVCGYGRSSPGIIGDRLGPVQLLSPDRHGNGTGDLGIRRRQRDLGRMAPTCRISPAGRTTAGLTARC